MMVTVLTLVSLAASATPAQTPADVAALHVRTLQQRRDALQTSVTQVKRKTGADPQGLAALEKQYATLAASVEKWQSAALASDAAARKGTDGLARDAARQMAQFARDARTYADGRPSSVNNSAASLFEKEYRDAARSFEKADQAARQAIARDIAWQAWADIK